MLPTFEHLAVTVHLIPLLSAPPLLLFIFVAYFQHPSKRTTDLRVRQGKVVLSAGIKAQFHHRPGRSLPVGYECSTETSSTVYINPVPWVNAGQDRKLEHRDCSQCFIFLFIYFNNTETNLYDPTTNILTPLTYLLLCKIHNSGHWLHR